MTIEHLDDQGQPCSVHAPATLDELLFLAVVGSRSPGFHHDLASKLQGLMMALDEISEQSNDPNVATATETALSSLREVLAQLNGQRALTKPPARTAVVFRELLALASERVYVTISGELVDATIHVSAPSTLHALSLALDVAAGPGRGRTLPATARLDGTHVELRLGCAQPPPSNSGESLAVATYVLTRDHGALHCTADGTHLVVRLPLVGQPA